MAVIAALLPCTVEISSRLANARSLPKDSPDPSLHNDLSRCTWGLPGNRIFWLNHAMSYLRRFASSFSAVGLIAGLVLACISLTPSMLPRAVLVQGVLAGLVFALGYGIGATLHEIWEVHGSQKLTGEDRANRNLVFRVRADPDCHLHAGQDG